MKRDKILLGFWKSEDKPELPMPVKNSWKNLPAKKRFLAWYKEFLETYDECRAYKGSSTCRLCGGDAGSYEYVFTFKTKNGRMTLFIPEGYEHYIEEHNVKPPLKFFKALKNKEYDLILDMLVPYGKCSYLVKG